MSRVNDLSNLHLIGTYNLNAFRVNNNLASEYNRLKDNSCFIPLDIVNLSNCCLTVTLLNIISLRKHLQEIKKDKNLVENGVLSLTETRVCRGNNISGIREQLNGL